MRVWWANQGRTGAEERAAGVLWAPLRGARGWRVLHFAALADMQVGDLVLHYQRGFIVAVSAVRAAAVEAPRPYRPDDRTGRRVEVDTAELDLYLPLAAIPRAVREASAGPGSVFTVHGGVRNGYVFTVPEPARTAVVALLGIHDTTDTDPQTLSLREVGGDTDRSRVGSYRVEQPELRLRTVGLGASNVCAFCHRRFPVRFLVAAHVKPRAACSFTERTDANIAVPACVLGCDALYEHGVIHVDADGTVHTADPTSDDALGAAAAAVHGNTVAAYGPGNARYFAWHRQHRSQCRQ